MQSKSSLKLDLNNLFQPALSDGVSNLEDLEKDFLSLHSGISALKKTGQLAFANLPYDEEMLADVLQTAKSFKKPKNVVVLGIGGSALGTKSIYHALTGPFGNYDSDQTRLFVVDNVDPAVMLKLKETVDAKETLFVVISKSGNTSETLAQYLFCQKHFDQFDSDNVVLITDPDSGTLRDLSKTTKHKTLPVPHGVGGRFSVFSPVGLFPLAVAGVDIEELLSGARHNEKNSSSNVLAQNQAALFSLALDFWFRSRNVSQMVMMPYSDHLFYFSDWVAQLFAESLNKRHTLSGGAPAYTLTPIKALGTTDQHSQLQLYLDGVRDKVICFVEFLHHPQTSLDAKTIGDERLDFLAGQDLGRLLNAEKAATEESLRENDRPNLTIQIPEINAFQLGQLYQLFMNAIPYLGGLLDINPYDQPAVERIKKFTFGLMGRKGFEDFSKRLEEHPKKSEFVF